MEMMEIPKFAKKEKRQAEFWGEYILKLAVLSEINCLTEFEKTAHLE